MSSWKPSSQKKLKKGIISFITMMLSSLHPLWCNIVAVKLLALTRCIKYRSASQQFSGRYFACSKPSLLARQWHISLRHIWFRTCTIVGPMLNGGTSACFCGLLLSAQIVCQSSVKNCMMYQMCDAYRMRRAYSDRSDPPCYYMARRSCSIGANRAPGLCSNHYQQKV